MQVSHFDNRGFSVAESASVLAEALQPYLETPVLAADAAALTGMPIEQARSALVYLAVRNAALVTFVGDDVAYIFSKATASIGGMLPSSFRSFTRYVGDLVASQAAYFLGALVAIGPAFIGVTMLAAGADTGNLFHLLAGGTLAFAATGMLLMLALRSLSVVLPPLVLAGVAIGWDQWTANDLYWLPLAVIVAIAMQADILLGFRTTRPSESLRLLFWGRGFSGPLRDGKRLTDLITSLGGTVTIGDLMRSFGWTADQAGEQLAAILIEYGGDIAVDRAGRMYLRFDELAQTKVESDAPPPAYTLERKAPGPFHGLDAGWVFVVAVVCWIGLVASPLNPAYTNFVAGFDVTLAGFGKLIRMALAGLFAVPLLVYFGRLVLNVLERPEFGERRAFLDALEYADRHAAGSHVSLTKFTTKHLIALNAQIDEERAIPGAMWVSFPDLQKPDGQVDRETIFDVFTKEEDVELLSVQRAAAVSRR